MLSLIKRGGALLLALPILALAEPVTVTMQSSGLTYANNIVLGALGLADVPYTDRLPYELTLTSTFDPVATPPGRGQWVSDKDSEVVIDFRIGTQRYHYEGIGSSSAILYTPSVTGGDSYQHEIWFPPLGPYRESPFKVSNMAIGPAGSMGSGGALASRKVDSAALEGFYEFNAYPSNPDAPGFWPMGDSAAVISVRIASAVPEPAPFALMAAGLLALGLRRRRGRVPA